jgi:putative redox protein
VGPDAANIGPWDIGADCRQSIRLRGDKRSRRRRTAIAAHHFLYRNEHSSFCFDLARLVSPAVDQTEKDMVTARRCGERYGVEITNGRNRVVSDTCKNGTGGDTGMRPHELLESALAACVCISIDMAVQRTGANLPPFAVDATVERFDDETSFTVKVQFDGAVSDADREVVRVAARESPVARTLCKPVRVALA